MGVLYTGKFFLMFSSGTKTFRFIFPHRESLYHLLLGLPIVVYYCYTESKWTAIYAWHCYIRNHNATYF